MLETHLPETEEFASQLNILGSLLSLAGYNLMPYRHESLPLFCNLTPPQQKDVLKSLKAYCMALEDGIVHEENINSTRMVWRFLVALGFFPHEDLFDTVREESYIQIYNFDQFQIFRSLSFFDKCSFTLEEIVCRPWWQLWRRSRQDLHILSEVSRQNLVCPQSKTLRFDNPFEMAQEISDGSAHQFSYRIKSATALTRSGRLHATLLVEDWRPSHS